MIQNEMPEFITQLDGGQPDISTAEQHIVARKFAGLYLDLILNHPLEVTGDSSNLFGTYDELGIDIPSTPRSGWAAELSTMRPPSNEAVLDPADVPRQVIDIHRYVQGDVHEMFSYGLYADGIVRRHDAGDITQNKRQAQDLGEDLQSFVADCNIPKTPEKREVERRQIADLFRSGVANASFEVELRLNGQPIGIDEIQGLEAMLTGQDAIVL